MISKQRVKQTNENGSGYTLDLHVSSLFIMYNMLPNTVPVDA